MQELSIVAEQVGKKAAAELDRLARNRLEHGPRLGPRAADDAQNLGCCRLFVECGRQLTRARLQRIEQTGILNGNDGLVGKGRQQLDLARRKGPHLATVEDEDADRTTVAEQRDTEQSSKFTQPLGLVLEVFVIGKNVADLDGSPFLEHATDD